MDALAVGHEVLALLAKERVVPHLRPQYSGEAWGVEQVAVAEQSGCPEPYISE